MTSLLFLIKWKDSLFLFAGYWIRSPSEAGNLSSLVSHACDGSRSRNGSKAERVRPDSNPLTLMAVCPEEEASDSVSHSLERGRWTIVVGSSDVVVTQAPLGGGYTRRQWLHATSVVTHTHHQWLHTHTHTHTHKHTHAITGYKHTPGGTSTAGSRGYVYRCSLKKCNTW